MKKVAAYIRVSTDAQAGEDRFGLEAQEQSLNEYASTHDMQIIQWFSDKGESGAKLRPGFDEIVYGEVTNPPYEAVLVAKSDRVARDINVYYYYKMLLLKKNIELISIAEDFGAMGSFASLLEAFTICAAQMERENITKRTSAGRKVKASKGGYAGGRAPMGYRIENGNLVVNEEEAKLVRFLFKLREENPKVSMREAAKAANEAGFLTRYGKPVSFSNVQNIWQQERTYRGEYHYGKTDEWVKGQHEAILKEDEE